MPEYTNDYYWQQTHTAGKGGGLLLATVAGIGQNIKVENVRMMT